MMMMKTKRLSTLRLYSVMYPATNSLPDVPSRKTKSPTANSAASAT